MNKYGFTDKEWNETLSIFKKHKEIEKIVLFGSRAKNTFKPMSDVDIVLFGKKITHSIIAGLQSDFEDSQIPYFFDIIAYKTITSEELKEHIRIYGKTIMSDSKNIPKGWVETTLGEVVSKLGDGLHGTPKYSDDGEYFFINGNNLNEGKIEIKQETKRCSIEEYEKYKKNLNSRTILVSINGSLGYFAYYNNEKCFLGKSVCYFNVKETVSKEFIGYQVRTNYFQKYIERLAGGTTIKNVSLKTMREFSFIIPELEEQKQIAKILTAFDDKIENLQAQNKTLEDIGQAIFKEWFGKYKNEDFENSENILEFEKGIEVGSKNYFDNKKTLESPKRFYRVGDIAYNGKQASIFTEEKFLKNKVFEKKDVLISFDGTIGRVFVGGAGGYSTGIRKVYSKEKFNYIKNSFIYFWGKSKNIQETIKLYSEGTTIQHAGKSIKYLKIISDKESILEAQKQLTPIFEKILLNLKQIQTLQQTRNTLLPKLMSGELRI